MKIVLKTLALPFMLVGLIIISTIGAVGNVINLAFASVELCFDKLIQSFKECYRQGRMK